MGSAGSYLRDVFPDTHYSQVVSAIATGLGAGAITDVDLTWRKVRDQGHGGARLDVA